MLHCGSVELNRYCELPRGEPLGHVQNCVEACVERRPILNFQEELGAKNPVARI